MKTNGARAIALALLAMGATTAQAGILNIQNTYTDKEVWVTTYEGGRQLQSFCIPKGAKKTVDNPQYGHNTIKVRTEVMTGPACKGTKICDTDMMVDGKGTTGHKDLQRAIVYVHPHAKEANRCYLDFSEGAGTGTGFPVVNTYPNRYVWITTQEVKVIGSPQIGTQCINPGQTQMLYDDRYQKNFWVRAEVMTEAGCKGQKVCDTKTERGHPRNAKIFVRQNAKDPNNCHLGLN